MIPVKPTMLTTPLDIWRAVAAHIPSAEGAVHVEADQSVTLNLTLSRHVPVISLRGAVDSERFEESIKKLKRHLESDKLFHQPRNHVVKVERFSTMEPLSDWQKFRRVMYEKSGRSCVDLICNYLLNPAEEAQLLYLGLAPVQVEANRTEADFEYFKRVGDRLQAFPERCRAIFGNFQRLYPNVCRPILEEIWAQPRRAELGNEDDSYPNTLLRLRGDVIGQFLATERMAAALTAQVNLERNQVFLFVGPTGVGKTELAKAASKIKGARLCRFDMNQYQGEVDFNKLFGSASGYVGSTDKPHFAQAIDQHTPIEVGAEGSTRVYEISNLVLLFDEFEKAHAKVKQSLLTLFDEGYCVMNYTQGRTNISIKYRFKRCVLINTCNLYQQEVLQAFQREIECDQIIAMFKQCNLVRPLESSLSQELLGRMTIIPFGFVPRGECYQRLISLKFRSFRSELVEALPCRDVNIENENVILLDLENKLYGDGTDIRRIERYFEAVRVVIYEQSPRFGTLKTLKITFSSIEGAACIKFSTFIAEFGVYHEPMGLGPVRLP